MFVVWNPHGAWQDLPRCVADLLAMLVMKICSCFLVFQFPSRLVMKVCMCFLVFNFRRRHDVFLVNREAPAGWMLQDFPRGVPGVDEDGIGVHAPSRYIHFRLQEMSFSGINPCWILSSHRALGTRPHCLPRQRRHLCAVFLVNVAIFALLLCAPVARIEGFKLQ